MATGIINQDGPHKNGNIFLKENRTFELKKTMENPTESCVPGLEIPVEKAWPGDIDLGITSTQVIVEIMAVHEVAQGDRGFKKEEKPKN